tara:strand:+ start:3035 stop:3250 length:216 start_codon:yes stop_codon:yes gene_type:complete
MKSIVLILKNIKGLLPYFILISIYFFFINLETIREKNKNRINQEGYEALDPKSDIDKNSIRIKIPVIPYKE